MDELKQRLLAIQALETARCFEEGVLTDVREADVGSILGFGYAPYSGGTLSYIDMMGTKKFVALCERLAQKYGERFKPNKLLRRDGGARARASIRALRRSGRSRRRNAAASAHARESGHPVLYAELGPRFRGDERLVVPAPLAISSRPKQPET